MNHGDSGLAATGHHVDVLCGAGVQQTIEVDRRDAEGTYRCRCEIDHRGAQRRDLAAIFGMHVGRRGVKDEVDRGLVEPGHQTIYTLGRCFESELTRALNTGRFLDTHHPGGLDEFAALALH